MVETTATTPLHGIFGEGPITHLLNTRKYEFTRA